VQRAEHLEPHRCIVRAALGRIGRAIGPWFVSMTHVRIVSEADRNRIGTSTSSQLNDQIRTPTRTGAVPDTASSSCLARSPTGDSEEDDEDLARNTNHPNIHSNIHSNIHRIVTVVVAGGVLGVAGGYAMASAEQAPASPSGHDQRPVAEWAQARGLSGLSPASLTRDDD
jgi:hypothetical protein